MDNKPVQRDQSDRAEPIAKTPAGSSNPTDNETVERNPVLMEDILDNVFKYINNRDIMNARLVCKTWRWSATKLLKSKFSFYWGQWDQWGEVRADEPVSRRFLDTMKNSELLPVKNYYIYCILPTTTEDDGELGDFLRICGPDIVSLGLHLYQGSKVRRKRKIEIPKEVKVGKLKKLRISTTNCRNGALDSNLPEFYRLAGLILDSATMLQKFEYHVDDMLFKSLADRGLQLNEIILVDNVKPKSMEESETIRKFLQTQTATLQRLEIFNGSFLNLGCSLSLPIFPKLVHLKLGNVEIAQVVVGEMFPKLRCLDVMSWLYDLFLPDIIIVKKLSTTLKALWLPRRYPFERVRKLSLDFPLITEIHLIGRRHWMVNLLEQVLIHFPLLKHLSLDFAYLSLRSFYVDSVLCGIPRDVCRQISRLPLTQLRNLKLSELQNRPSVVNLTLLEKLEILNHAQDGPSDVSAQFVFLRMPNLKELLVDRGLLSTACIEMLMERIPNFKFSRNDDPPTEDEDSDEQHSESDMEDYRKEGGRV